MTRGPWISLVVELGRANGWGGNALDLRSAMVDFLSNQTNGTWVVEFLLPDIILTASLDPNDYHGYLQMSGFGDFSCCPYGWGRYVW